MENNEKSLQVEVASSVSGISENILANELLLSNEVTGVKDITLSEEVPSSVPQFLEKMPVNSLHLLDEINEAPSPPHSSDYVPAKDELNSANKNEDMDITSHEVVPYFPNNSENILAENLLTETYNDDTTLPEEETASPHECALNGWTKDEKFLLYLGIKLKSSKNLTEIQESIPTKTLEEIEAAIAHYKYRASKTTECANKKLKVKKGKTKSLIPLANWAKLLTDNFSYEELQTETVSALRLIANFDKIPSPKLTEEIDFRRAYCQIADAMEGKSLTEIKYISEMLNSCIFETCLVSRSFIAMSVFKSVINTVDFKNPLPGFPRINKNCELSIIRHLASHQNYNPLGIPADNLMPVSSKKM